MVTGGLMLLVADAVSYLCRCSWWC